mmetsp:Transcript_15287/g.49932  ORF Transcript_15287/g.49932 Transcript_15287/m.49932 type:complete len:188 (-) Transcript_15287:235-798(-)
MRDVHYEVKCWNPLIKSTTSGRGSWDKGGNVASVGHLYGFGKTLDKALTAVVGCKERGRQVDGPLDHSTGKGWVKDHAYGDGWVKKNAGCRWMGAQYYDAKWIKKAITRLVLVETLGGIAPPTKQSSSTCSPRKRRAPKHGPDGVRGGVGERLLLRRPPHAADLHGGGGGRRRKHQQAGAQCACRLG